MRSRISLSVAVDKLAVFLARHASLSEEPAVWGSVTHPLPLRIRAYLTVEAPPLTYIISVRSLVFHDADGALLVLRNRDSTHIMPSGHREPNETLEQTLRREVLEETGWTLRAPTVLGFMHFHHLGPKPPGHPYPLLYEGAPVIPLCRPVTHAPSLVSSAGD